MIHPPATQNLMEMCLLYMVKWCDGWCNTKAKEVTKTPMRYPFGTVSSHTRFHGNFTSSSWLSVISWHSLVNRVLHSCHLMSPLYFSSLARFLLSIWRSHNDNWAAWHLSKLHLLLEIVRYNWKLVFRPWEMFPITRIHFTHKTTLIFMYLITGCQCAPIQHRCNPLSPPVPSVTLCCTIFIISKNIFYTVNVYVTVSTMEWCGSLLPLQCMV